MPNFTPLQNDFSAGELTPELFMRPQLRTRRGEVYQSGLKECINFWADARGPLRARDGFRYIGAVIGRPGFELDCGPGTAIPAPPEDSQARFTLQYMAAENAALVTQSGNFAIDARAFMFRLDDESFESINVMPGAGAVFGIGGSGPGEIGLGTHAYVLDTNASNLASYFWDEFGVRQVQFFVLSISVGTNNFWEGRNRLLLQGSSTGNTTGRLYNKVDGIQTATIDPATGFRFNWGISQAWGFWPVENKFCGPVIRASDSAACWTTISEAGVMDAPVIFDFMQPGQTFNGVVINDCVVVGEFAYIRGTSNEARTFFGWDTANFLAKMNKANQMVALWGSGEGGAWDWASSSTLRPNLVYVPRTEKLWSVSGNTIGSWRLSDDTFAFCQNTGVPTIASGVALGDNNFAYSVEDSGGGYDFWRREIF